MSVFPNSPYFCTIMLRPVISYAFTSLILLSQIGLPLHMHYCKGILESVSFFFAAECDDHNIPVDLPACCKKAMANHCSKNGSKKCCDDEVMVVKQEITSLAPSFVKWIDISDQAEMPSLQKLIPVITSLPYLISGNTSDSGPPIYILHCALVFYA